MSLQVWLPLNGNLNNQGLSEVTSTGGTVNNTGILGKCYACTSSSYITIQNLVTDKYDFSFSFWMKVPTTLSSVGAWNTMFLFRTLNKNNNSTETSVGISWTDYNNIKIYDEANHQNIWMAPGNQFNYDKWCHYTITHTGNDSSTTIKVYTDGILRGTFNNSHRLVLRSGNILLGSGINPSYGPIYFNDFRLYDHCLSAKEIKEISKGLLCHYKLDNGFGNPNLLSNSHFDSRYTVSNWDTSKNGNLCASSWGGYNGGVGNPSTVYHAHLQEHEGDYVYNYHKTSNEGWLGISQVVTGRVEVSKTYTFSCELKRVSGKNYADGGLYTRANSSSTSNTFVNWFSFSNFSSVTDNKWHRYSHTFTVDSSVYMANGVSWYIYGHTGGDGEFLMRRPKLEEGSSATEWIPHTSDSLYISLGLSSTTESDCSGLFNNGTKIGGLSSSTSPVSIRYESCYDFDGGTGSIQIPNLSTLVPSGEFTMNCWIYHDNTWSSKTWETIFGGPSGFELEAKNSSTNSPVLYAYSWGKGSAAYELNKWNMITMTRNASETRFYINGKLKITGSAGTIPSGNYFIGAWNSSSQQNYKGRISDFRLYSTVLSVEDIKELYNTSASVDKNGNMYAYEFKEE